MMAVLLDEHLEIHKNDLAVDVPKEHMTCAINLLDTRSEIPRHDPAGVPMRCAGSTADAGPIEDPVV